MIELRTLHLIVGTVGLIAFLLTGQHMHWVHHHLQGMHDGPRLFFRSAHIYLLWSSLLNVLVGCYLARLTSRLARHVQLLASLAILAGPLLLCVSFFHEPYNAGLLRPVGRAAVVLATAGVLAHAGAAITGQGATSR